MIFKRILIAISYYIAKHNRTKDLKRKIRQNKYLNPLVTAVGIFCLFLALVGVFLPFIPGVLFFILGIIILGEEFFLTRWLLKKSPKRVRDRLERRKEKKNAGK